MNIAEIALSFYGLTEIPGEEHNPEILGFFKELGHTWAQTDETAWCAAFANYCLKMAGYPHTGMLYAKSFLGIGEPISVPVPLGASDAFVDVALFWRHRPWRNMLSDIAHFETGHVAFHVKERGNLVYVYGGNQGNQAKLGEYLRPRLVEYRRIYRL